MNLKSGDDLQKQGDYLQKCFYYLKCSLKLKKKKLKTPDLSLVCKEVVLDKLILASD